jgi:hypothetical protein
MSKTTVFGVLLSNRINTASKFQEIITNYGCSIKTRIGLHDVSEGKCSSNGVILLEVIGDDSEIINLEKDLATIPDVKVQKMVFEDI